MNPTRTVVIIDDHPLFLTVLGDLLSQTPGFSVVGMARTGQEGLDLCERTQPEIVLLDMMMPGMSGLELLTKLRQRSRESLLLPFSGLATEQIMHMAILAGANGYISKSESIEEFIRILRAICDGKAALSVNEASALRSVVRDRLTHKSISLEDLEILRLFSGDVPVKDIAAQTGRTGSAVYKALQRTKRHFDAKSNADLRAVAQRLGLGACKEGPA